MNVVIWARVSSREQSEGYSLDAQIRINRDKAEREGWTVVREFVVAESARRGVERAAFRDMYTWIKTHANRRKIEAVLAHKLDRICRNMRDAVRMQELEDAVGVKMVFVDNEFGPGPAGALNFNVMAAVSQYYSDNLRQEVRKGQDEKIRQGWMPCGVPYGYVNTSDPEEPVRPHPEKAKLVIRLFRLCSQGNTTSKMLADHLERDGFVYRPNQPRIPPGSVSYLLRNRFYVGDIVWRGKVHPGKHQPLVDRHTFELCGDLLDNRKRHVGRLMHTYGKALFRCVHCDRAMTGERIRRKRIDGSVKIHNYYRCGNNQKRADHPKLRWREADLEKAVVAQLDPLRMPTPELRDWFREALRQATAQLRNEQAVRQRGMKRRITEFGKQRERLVTQFLEGQIDADMYQQILASLQGRVREVEAALATLEGAGDGVADVTDRVHDFTQNAKTRWPKASEQVKQRVLRAVSTSRMVAEEHVKLEFRKPFSLIGQTGSDRRRTSQADRQEWILDQLYQGVKLTRAMVENQFGIRKKQAKRMLAPLVQGGLIAFVRAPRPGYYRLVSKGVSPNPSVTP